MREYVNGLVLIEGKLVQKNFAIENGLVLFDYTSPAETIDIKGKVVSPGFVDLHVHTRVPGFEYKEDLKSVTEAALKGGVTTFVAMANTSPAPVDYGSLESMIKANESDVDIIQAARVTHKGKVVDMDSLIRIN